MKDNKKDKDITNTPKGKQSNESIADKLKTSQEVEGLVKTPEMIEDDAELEDAKRGSAENKGGPLSVITGDSDDTETEKKELHSIEELSKNQGRE